MIDILCFAKDTDILEIIQVMPEKEVSRVDNDVENENIIHKSLSTKKDSKINNMLHQEDSIDESSNGTLE